MNKVNYQKILEATLENKSNLGKKLLLHSCCAPCSSYCLTYLSEFFEITVFYYNPNITMEPEYQKRVVEQKKLIQLLNEEKSESRYPIHILEGEYEPALFYEMAKGMEALPEGGERCFGCYRLRLEKTAEVAKEKQFDYFTTTLTISPLKNAQKLNEIGTRLEEEYGVAYLLSDFKKKNGYLTSIELSKKYDLYRQDYCGCVYSKLQREKEKAEMR